MKQKEEGVAWLRTQNFYPIIKVDSIRTGSSVPFDTHLSLCWRDTARLRATLIYSGFSAWDAYRWSASYYNFLIS